jgi:hypothetical protein
MRPAETQKQIKGQPFVPLRMRLSEGPHYDIRHPEMVIVSLSVIGLAVYGQKNGELAERVVLCDPMHITSLEPIDGGGA